MSPILRIQTWRDRPDRVHERDNNVTEDPFEAHGQAWRATENTEKSMMKRAPFRIKPGSTAQYLPCALNFLSFKFSGLLRMFSQYSCKASSSTSTSVL